MNILLDVCMKFHSDSTKTVEAFSFLLKSHFFANFLAVKLTKLKNLKFRP